MITKMKHKIAVTKDWIYMKWELAEILKRINIATESKDKIKGDKITVFNLTIQNCKKYEYGHESIMDRITSNRMMRIINKGVKKLSIEWVLFELLVKYMRNFRELRKLTIKDTKQDDDYYRNDNVVDFTKMNAKELRELTIESTIIECNLSKRRAPKLKQITFRKLIDVVDDDYEKVIIDICKKIKIKEVLVNINDGHKKTKVRKTKKGIKIERLDCLKLKTTGECNSTKNLVKNNIMKSLISFMAKKSKTIKVIIVSGDYFHGCENNFLCKFYNLILHKYSKNVKMVVFFNCDGISYCNNGTSCRYQMIFGNANSSRVVFAISDIHVGVFNKIVMANDNVTKIDLIYTQLHCQQGRLKMEMEQKIAKQIYEMIIASKKTTTIKQTFDRNIKLWQPPTELYMLDSKNNNEVLELETIMLALR